MSPEELRLDAYTAMQQGTVDIYVSEYLKIMQTRGVSLFWGFNIPANSSG